MVATIQRCRSETFICGGSRPPETVVFLKNKKQKQHKNVPGGVIDVEISCCRTENANRPSEAASHDLVETRRYAKAAEKYATSQRTQPGRGEASLCWALFPDIMVCRLRVCGQTIVDNVR